MDSFTIEKDIHGFVGSGQKVAVNVQRPWDAGAEIKIDWNVLPMKG